MTVNEFKISAVKQLDSITDNAAFEVQQLMCSILSWSVNELLINKSLKLSSEQTDKLNFALSERLMHVPIQYICGEWEFMGLKMHCGPGCLIPRPETEMLAEMCIKILKQNGRILDLCTGSGCIAVSVLKKRLDAKCFAIDISEDALGYARNNAVLHGVNDRINFICEDAFSFKTEQKFDVIVSNPPYIKTADMESLSPEVKKEPYIALDGGEDGLNFYKLIASVYKNFLSDDGYIITEVGYDIANDVAQLFELHGFEVQVLNDMFGVNRVCTAKKM